MRERQVPILFIMSENDRLIEAEISYEMSTILGANGDHHSIYNRDDELQKERTSGMPWVLVLREAGHYSFRKQPAVVNAAIYSLLLTAVNGPTNSANVQ